MFVGHGVIFINDKRPRATTDEGELQTDEDWELVETVIERGPRSARARSSWAASGSARCASSGPARWSRRTSPPGEVVAGNPARALALNARGPERA